MVVFCPCWLTPMYTLHQRQGLMLEGEQVSRGNRGMKLMLEALDRLNQEAFWVWMQQRDQTDLRRNDMDKLVRDIQQAFASGDRESARLLSKQLESEHIATLQALQRLFTDAGRMQSATFTCWRRSFREWGCCCDV